MKCNTPKAAIVIVLLSLASPTTGFKGFLFYPNFFKMPSGQLKFFFGKVGPMTEVRVEYMSKEVTDQCKDYNRRGLGEWKECTVKLEEGDTINEGIQTHDLLTSGSLNVKVNGTEHYVICGRFPKTELCLVTIFGSNR